MPAPILRGARTSRLNRILLLFTLGLCCRNAFAASDVQPADQASAEVSVARIDVLPDAPLPAASIVPANPTAAASLPLEQQEHPPVTIQKLPLNILRDGINIAVSPAYLRARDLKWILPLTGAAAAAFATDTRTMTQVVSTNPSFNQTNVNISDGLRDGFIAAPIAMFGLGEFRQKDRMRETGLLGSEAMVDAIAVDEVIKLCSFRERPTLDNAQGEFYVGRAGVDSSFVSGHSMIAWSSAAVIAAEYPSRWVQASVYTLAAGVSATRVMGQQHFPSDVLLGAAGGWLIGHYVFRAHHHLPLRHATK